MIVAFFIFWKIHPFYFRGFTKFLYFITQIIQAVTNNSCFHAFFVQSYKFILTGASLHTPISMNLSKFYYILIYKVYKSSILWQQIGNIHAISFVEISSRVVHIPCSNMLLATISLQHILCEDSYLRLVERVSNILPNGLARSVSLHTCRRH